MPARAERAVGRQRGRMARDRSQRVEDRDAARCEEHSTALAVQSARRPLRARPPTMSFAEYSTALVEEVRRSTPRERQLHHIAPRRPRVAHALLSGGGRRRGRLAAPRRRRSRTSSRASSCTARARPARRGSPRTAGCAPRRWRRGRAHNTTFCAGARRPRRLHDLAAAATRRVRLRARPRLFMKAASASRPLDHVYVAGSVDAAAFYTKAPKAERRCAARATRAAITPQFSAARPQFSLAL